MKSTSVNPTTEPQGQQGAFPLAAGSPLYPDQLCVGDQISESPVGAGEVTDFTPAGYARVNYVAVAWCRRPDGLTYDPLGKVGGSCVANARDVPTSGTNGKPQ